MEQTVGWGSAQWGLADKSPRLLSGKCSTARNRLWNFPSCLPLLLWFQQRWQVFPVFRARLFVELLFNRTAQMLPVDTSVRHTRRQWKHHILGCLCVIYRCQRNTKVFKTSFEVWCYCKAIWSIWRKRNPGDSCTSSLTNLNITEKAHPNQKEMLTNLKAFQHLRELECKPFGFMGTPEGFERKKGCVPLSPCLGLILCTDLVKYAALWSLWRPWRGSIGTAGPDLPTSVEPSQIWRWRNTGH